MTFIKGLSNSIPITASPDAQSEITSQAQTQTSFGIANTADIFEANVSNNLDLLQPQPHNLSLMQPSITNDMTVDASSLFKYLEKSGPQPENRLMQLAAESEKKLGEKEQFATVLDKLDEQKGSIEEPISEQGFNSKLMTAEAPWQEFLPNETIVQNDNVPSAVPISPDIQKLMNDE